MGRKYSTESSSDDGLPELDDFINTHVKSLQASQAPKLMPNTRMPVVASPQRLLAQTSSRKATASRPAQIKKPKPLAVRGSDRAGSRAVGSQPILPQDVLQSALAKTFAETKPTTCSNASKVRATPHRAARKPAPVLDLSSGSEDDDEDTDDDDDDDDDEFLTAEEREDVEESSIWCDSDVEPIPQKRQEDVLSRFKKLQIRHLSPDPTLSESDEDLDSTIFKSRSPRKPLKTFKSPAKEKKAFHADLIDSSDKENDSSAGLRLPPLTLQPTPMPTGQRPSTPPPASPSKSRLVSPSKKKARIPTPPHRPSIDAFWNPHAVNGWNDQYSPQKPLVSPKKNRFLPRDEDDSDSPTSSPRKSQSPTKRSRAEMQAKKDFENRKHVLCEDFFEELDREVTGGKIKELAASTGGVRFIWSKTLNSTAGRANWRKETQKTTNTDGTICVVYKHHASIELAEKVINDEERLLNVVAHEFCHLANFMVSGIKDQPHGRQFKIWGAKCTKAFGDRGVEVTTKHSYEIDYKYIWSCTNEICGREFKRHSKSIDPARHTCGACRAKLIQVKPVPRKQGGKAAVGGYAAFVKQNFALIKAEMAGASHKEVMTALGQRYREQKAATAGAEVEDVAKALEVVNLD